MGEDMFIKKPTRFMTNSEYIGQALSERCRGQHRHMELTGGGRTKRSEVYPDKLCRAMLDGRVQQMSADGRSGCSFKSDDSQNMDVDDEDMMDVDEVRTHEDNEQQLHELTWTRRDYGTTR